MKTFHVPPGIDELARPAQLDLLDLGAGIAERAGSRACVRGDVLIDGEEAEVEAERDAPAANVARKRQRNVDRR